MCKSRRHGDTRLRRENRRRNNLRSNPFADKKEKLSKSLMYDEIVPEAHRNIRSTVAAQKPTPMLRKAGDFRLEDKIRRCEDADVE